MVRFQASVMSAGPYKPDTFRLVAEGKGKKKYGGNNCNLYSGYTVVEQKRVRHKVAATKSPQDEALTEKTSSLLGIAYSLQSMSNSHS